MCPNYCAIIRSDNNQPIDNVIIRMKTILCTEQHIELDASVQVPSLAPAIITPSKCRRS